MRPSDVLLMAGATARLSRLITTDHLGKWWIKDPIDAAMDRYEVLHTHPIFPDGVDHGKTAQDLLSSDYQGPAVVGWEPEREPWWWKYRAGLDCPFCIGFWLTGAVMLSRYLVGRDSRAVSVWRFVTGVLSLNYVVAHVSSRLDAEGKSDE